VTWRSAPGERYLLQKRPTLVTGEWTDVSGVPRDATGFSLSETDPDTGTSREGYYRALLLPSQ
jgi:hypothetical protein